MPASVLIVHANTAIAERLKEVVADLDLDSCWAACAETACQAIRINRPQLVVLDGDLLLGSADLCRKFRSACPEYYLPILLLVPENSEDVNRYLCGAKVDDFICLPYSVPDLQARIVLRLACCAKKQIQPFPEIDYAFLAGLSQLAVADLDTTEILQRVVGAICEVIDVRRCSITMVREGTGVGYVLASSDDIGINGLKVDLERYPEIKETMSTGRPLLIDHIRQHPVMKDVLPYIENLNFDSIMVLPMVDRQRTVGVLVLRTARSIVGFTEDEISFCQLVANVATGALKMAELRQSEQERREPVILSVDADTASSRERSVLLGMAAHDLRVLVSVVDGYCLLLSETGEGTLSVEQNEIMNGLMTGSRRLVDMANNLLDYSRIEAGRFELHMEELDLCSVLKVVYSEVAPLLLKRNISMEVSCLGQDVSIVCDEEGIRRVFYNIVSNALKFTPDGGRINISLAVSDTEAKVSIEDNGPGIEPKILSRLFDEYVCSAGPDGQPGNGLGLSICKKIVEAHHGRIWAESSLGQGSCFTFCLPR